MLEYIPLDCGFSQSGERTTWGNQGMSFYTVSLFIFDIKVIAQRPQK